MNYNLSTDKAEAQSTDCIILGVYETGSKQQTPSYKAVNESSDNQLGKLIDRGDFKGRPNQALLVYDIKNIKAQRVLLVGCGKPEEITVKRFREIVFGAINKAKTFNAKNILNCLTELDAGEQSLPWKIRQIVELTGAALYRFNELKTKNLDTDEVFGEQTLMLPAKSGEKECKQAVAEGKAISTGVALTKTLGNLPGNICTPAYLAEQAQNLAKTSEKVKVEVLEKSDMEKLKMGALLSVARGSRQPPKLIVLQYNGGKKDAAPIALVGKGLTFDAGGISIKPAANMDEMKYDMCGGASVLGTFRALIELELPINVVGVIPSSENLPDGDANKPGDIVTSMNGQTIEVLNTDAEGRLILCDALCYTERFNPSAVIDIATLTGACVIALGGHATGVMGNDQALIDEVLACGQNTYDRAWPMPLWDEYQAQLDSNFADMANIGGREGGTITAACFLSRFTKKFKWAHLDIAGTAWKTGKEKGATGRPVSLLAQFLINRSQSI